MNEILTLIQTFGTPLVLFRSSQNPGRLVTITQATDNPDDDSDQIVRSLIPITDLTERLFELLEDNPQAPTDGTIPVSAVVFTHYTDQSIEVLLHHDDRDPIVYLMPVTTTANELIDSINQKLQTQ